MIFSCIWERYIFKELLKVFVFFLLCFFFLYVVILFSIQSFNFFEDGKIQILLMLKYYSFQFIKRTYLLTSLATLVAGVAVMCSMNNARELLALRASGVTLNTLLRPFFFLGVLCCTFNWICGETLLPKALNYIDLVEHKKYLIDSNNKRPFKILYLKDNSKLIYQKYLPETHQYYDVIWIRSFNDIWKIKILNGDPKHPLAEYADHLVRDSSGLLKKAESFDRCVLKNLTWQAKLSKNGYVPMENRKISELFRVLFHFHEISKAQYAEVFSYFLYKISIPMISVLIIMGITPYCIRYSRELPQFIIFSLSLFIFFSFFTISQSMIIIGENRILHPALAILTPYVLSFALFSWKLFKIS